MSYSLFTTWKSDLLRLAAYKYLVALRIGVVLNCIQHYIRSHLASLDEIAILQVPDCNRR
jgi:hypothetical protein